MKFMHKWESTAIKRFYGVWRMMSVGSNISNSNRNLGIPHYNNCTEYIAQSVTMVWFTEQYGGTEYYLDLTYWQYQEQVAVDRSR